MNDAMRVQIVRAIGELLAHMERPETVAMSLDAETSSGARTHSGLAGVDGAGRHGSLPKPDRRLVARALLRSQGKLCLSPAHLNVLLHLVELAGSNRIAFLSQEQLSTQMGKSRRQIRRYITQLEVSGFIERVKIGRELPRQQRETYSLDGLIQKLSMIGESTWRGRLPALLPGEVREAERGGEQQ